MTLCAAATNWNGSHKRIIVISDRKISFFGGQFAADIEAFKLASVHEQWSVMFAGENSLLVPMIHAVKDNRLKRRQNTLREFARLCSRSYREERRKIIETEILSKYDVDNYQAYLALRASDTTLYTGISKEIENIESNWNLLFFGFDKADDPHIFVISEFGKIQFCDIEGFAAIGSGAWAAYTTLTSLRYIEHVPLEECVYKMLVAKFTAEEAADGVGEDSIFAVMDSQHRSDSVWTISAAEIQELRQQWEARPLVPADAIELVRNSLFKPGSTRRKRLISRKTDMGK